MKKTCRRNATFLKSKIKSDIKNNFDFWFKKISCAYKMEPIRLFSLAAMKCVSDRNTHPDFKHIMRVTESEKYIKHLVTISTDGQPLERPSEKLYSVGWALWWVPGKLKTKEMWPF